MQKIASGLDMYLVTFPSSNGFPNHMLSRFPIESSHSFGESPQKPGWTEPFSRAAGYAIIRTVWPR